MNKSNKEKIVALILCIFLGTLGVHRFYVGKSKSGILYLCTLGLFGIGWIYDIFNIANNLFTDSYGAILTSENANQNILNESKKKPAHMMWQFWVAVVVLYVFVFAMPSNSNTGPTQQTSITISDTDKSITENIIDTNTETDTIINSHSESSKAISSDSDKNYDKDTSTQKSTSKASELEQSSSSNQINSSKSEPEYDALQNIFLEIDYEYTADSLLNSIKKNELEYTSEEYTGEKISGETICSGRINYKVAFTKKVAYQSHADNGDYLEVEFNIDNGTLMHAEYFNQENFATSLFYNYGIYYDFRYKESQNDYSGFYYWTYPDKDLSGTELKYYNGSVTTTKYSRCKTAQAALKGDIIKEVKSTESSKIESTNVDNKTNSKNENKVESKTKSEIEKKPESTSSTYVELPPQATTYHFVINEDTKKFHLSSCYKTDEILSDHRREVDITDENLFDAIQRLESDGYSHCKICLD